MFENLQRRNNSTDSGEKGRLHQSRFLGGGVGVAPDLSGGRGGVAWCLRAAVVFLLAPINSMPVCHFDPSAGSYATSAASRPGFVHEAALQAAPVDPYLSEAAFQWGFAERIGELI
ncbi:hypothetical protein Q8A73_002824 [Channa argus]|nr:hypothetical protein Q8A73_002824 [Channa argus]